MKLKAIFGTLVLGAFLATTAMATPCYYTSSSAWKHYTAPKGYTMWPGKVKVCLSSELEHTLATHMPGKRVNELRMQAAHVNVITHTGSTSAKDVAAHANHIEVNLAGSNTIKLLGKTSVRKLLKHNPAILANSTMPKSIHEADYPNRMARLQAAGMVYFVLFYKNDKIAAVAYRDEMKNVADLEHQQQG